ncbi:hypothetical protein ACIA8G_21295 [Lentzea sp. NPDC051213]|uniref:hypothetical protein n=1 Tax=Lentzea sp. NPDC051213 TaxID=3364126 RepID=UPI0037A68B31
MDQGLTARGASSRARLLDQVADAIPSPKPGGAHRIAVDGVDGAGKTVFADELAHVLRERGRQVVRASVDDFHQCREGSGRLFRRAIHDVQTDLPIDDPLEVVPAESILIVDGIFLHRDELVHNWDFSIFLAVDFEVSVARMAVRDGGSADVEDRPRVRISWSTTTM